MRLRRGALLASLIAFAFAALVSAQEAARPEKPKVDRSLPARHLKANAADIPQTYGVGTSYYRMGASEFTPMEEGIDSAANTFYNDGTTLRRFGLIGFDYFIGTPHLPSGAKLLELRINDCVASAGSVGGSLYSCNYYGDSCTELQNLDGTFAGCGSDVFDLSSLGIVVDNGNGGNQLVIRLRTTATDGSDSFSGVTLAYQLQVSPAPAVATFPDVPTSDFGFQFVEALVSSGITGGCGSGLYCPDSPVTRRQMAIFIAKALGLQWP